MLLSDCGIASLEVAEWTGFTRHAVNAWRKAVVPPRNGILTMLALFLQERAPRKRAWTAASVARLFSPTKEG